MDSKDFKIKEVNIGLASEQVQPEKKHDDSGKKPFKIKMNGLAKIFNKKNLPKALIVVFLILGAVFILSFVFGGNKPDSDNVRVSIRIPGSISSGDETVLQVDYFNDNRVGLKDSYLTIDYPPGTFSIGGGELTHERRDLGIIDKKSRGMEEFKVRFVGEKGDSKNIVAKLNFIFQNFSSPFENSTTSRLEINSVLVSINIEGPEKSIAGDLANYLIEYENKTEEDIRDLNLEITYDKDFKLKNIEPAPEEGANNIWQIPVLRAGEKRSINLIGHLNGREGETKPLKVTIGKIENDQLIQYSQSEYLTLISPPPILLNLALEGSEEDCKINPGQTLNYRIDFRNNTDVGLTGLILKAKLEDGVFNLRSIQIGEIGFFDSRENTVIWSGADVPALKVLEPNQSGSVYFSIELRDPVPMEDFNDKNILAEASTEIGTKTIPASFAVSELNIYDSLSCKINSKVDLKTRVYYNETTAEISNSGPMPPRVDFLTNFTVHWQISNRSNDLKGIRIYSVLPQGVDWTGVYINKVPGSTIAYNERTKEITWEIEKIPAGTGMAISGVKSPVYELIFQIAIRPSTNQIGTAPILVNEASLETRDSFTGILLRDYTYPVNTSVPDDPSVQSGNVRP